MAADPPALHFVAFIDERVVTRPLPATGSVTIGRDPASDIRLDHPSVSRHHAVLHLGPPLRIEDQGSANGTLVRTRPGETAAGETQRLWSAPSQPVELTPGDGLVLGFVAAVIRPAPAAAAFRTAAGAEPVVADAAMRLVFQHAERAARGPISLLVLGETGVGKEVLARFVHQRSPRAGGPFVGLNCAALSESLLESELFGHERGAFTGAVHARPGLIESAHRGTLFLDEVGELPLAFQVKLLRVLEEQTVLRVGGRTPIAVDFRVIAATNRDLDADVARGAFRHDLYFRLDGFSLTIPPLRERVAEIAVLARAFLDEAGPRFGRREPLAIAPDVLAALERYRWPGNLRELRNVIERAVVLCDGATLLPEHLPAKLAGDDAPGERCVLDARDRERRRIVDALALCAGNQSRAARMLGISRRTLVSRLDAYALARPLKRPTP